MNSPADAVIIGAGFYGLRIALFLRENLGYERVVVLERETSAMSRASYVNQARVHSGYHYPRSILTGYRSRVNLPDFVGEFGDAVVSDFDHYYAVARRLSKVNARQFELFCARIGAPYEAAEPDILRLFDKGNIEAVYKVTEPAFDSRIVRQILLDRVERVGGIEIRYEVEAVEVRSRGDEGLTVVTDADGDYDTPQVISAVYSRINVLHERSGLPLVGLQHEYTEMALVDLSPRLKGLGFTVMDGPFFSMMPFPSRGLHTLSHVRYTPQHRWREGVGDEIKDPHAVMDQLGSESRFRMMEADVARYLPAARDMKRVDSIWEVKTVLTKSENDDSRPILFLPDHGMTGYTCIMGGKLDNVYDVLQELTFRHER